MGREDAQELADLTPGNRTFLSKSKGSKHLFHGQVFFSLCPCVAEGARDLSAVLFYKGTNLIPENSTLMILSLPKVPMYKIHHIGD